MWLTLSSWLWLTSPRGQLLFLELGSCNWGHSMLWTRDEWQLCSLWKQLFTDSHGEHLQGIGALHSTGRREGCKCRCASFCCLEPAFPRQLQCLFRNGQAGNSSVLENTPKGDKSWRCQKKKSQQLGSFCNQTSPKFLTQWNCPGHNWTCAL